MRLFLRVALHFITNVHKIMDLNRWPFTIVTSVVVVVIVVDGGGWPEREEEAISPDHQIYNCGYKCAYGGIFIYMVAISDHIVPK